MMPFPKVHDLYIGRVVLGTVLATWAIVLGLDLVQALLIGELSDIGQGRYGFVEALAYVAYTAPRRAYGLFPTAAVVGALMGLGQLAASSELTALRALGLSRRRLSGAVALALAVFTILMVINGETLAPWAQRQADTLKAQARSNNMIMAQYTGVWAREGDMFLNASSGTQRTAGGDQWLERPSPNTVLPAGCCATSCARSSARARSNRKPCRSNAGRPSSTTPRSPRA
jgi:lipopolysaccharide export system permease protein